MVATVTIVQCRAPRCALPHEKSGPIVVVAGRGAKIDGLARATTPCANFVSFSNIWLFNCALRKGWDKVHKGWYGRPKKWGSHTHRWFLLVAACKGRLGMVGWLDWGGDILDLALDLTKTSGRPPKPVSVEIVRQLTQADLSLLSADRGIKPNPLKKLRDAHHAIARLVARGDSLADIAARTGYSYSRISILKADPTFMELVEFYRTRLEELRDEIDTDAFARAAAIRDLADEEILDRLNDNPESIPLDRLMEIGLKYGALTGRVAVSKTLSANLSREDIADALAAGRARATRLSASVKAFPAPADAASEGEVRLLTSPSDEKESIVE